MKISIIGIGAIGGYIAAHLLKHHQNQVQLLVKTDSTLSTSTPLFVTGLTQLSATIDEVIYDTHQLNGDVIFVTTKSTANDTLFKSLSHLKHKIFIILQNGIGAEAKLAKYIDKSNTIIGAISNIKVTKGKQIGEVVLHSHFRNLVYAVVQPSQPPLQQQNKLAFLPTLFKSIFNDVHALKNIYQVRFPKLMINIACNAASIIHDKTFYGLAHNQKSRKMIHSLSEEVRQVSQCYGVTIKANMMEDIINSFNAPQYKDVYFSMKQDFDSGLPLEMKYVFYHFIQLAEKANIPVPATRHAILELRNRLQTRDSAPL
ncbi:ketopantoate reductase C-terminal domain-containing protein [uncultured Shewanella sp.]|uniref:ketopantoate reductase family protein n=1 Tax=uncultured Shewanella sp. TaxID=173975 RepID=UPI0026316CDB|nr:ketopantoate reductase C-terminal domain-containing protein [uncultured Shewanella sp.]